MVAAIVGEPDGQRDGAELFVDVDDPAGDPSLQSANRELARQLHDAIGELVMTQRTAFLLHHVHGLALDDVAAVMGCRVGTVKSHIFRATEHLRTVLAPLVGREAH